MILQIGDTLIGGDILTDYFACDLAACHGACCIEGDAGAPVTLDEIDHIEQALPAIAHHLTTEARQAISEQGVAYPDPEGEMVTQIVGGRDCAFLQGSEELGVRAFAEECLGANPEPSGHSSLIIPHSSLSKTPHSPLPKGCALCALELHAGFKPQSCALYPIRIKKLSNGLTALNYHRWHICQPAIDKGRREGTRLYQFLRQPLIAAFGQEWYDELCIAAAQVSIDS